MTDGWIHLSDSEPRARKPYRCQLCGLRIRKGAKHVARRGRFDGKPVTVRMHAVCHSKTRSWGENEWETLDESDFRLYDLEMRAMP